MSSVLRPVEGGSHLITFLAGLGWGGACLAAGALVAEAGGSVSGAGVRLEAWDWEHWVWGCPGSQQEAQ